MNRYLAMFLLALLIGGLLHSVYSFSQGRFGQGMIMFPLLAGCYVLFLARDRQGHKDSQQEAGEQDQKKD
ncbi:MAG: hypothetical protein ACLFOA_00275 [Desulfohalobiaceae bacterium]